MKYGAAIFDLDGTLLDTLEDLADSINETLRMYSFPERTIAEIRTFIGGGARNHILGSLPEGVPPVLVDECVSAYSACYSRNMKNKTRPYDGILEMLRKLRQNGTRIAVCSNKGDSDVRELCREHFGDLVDAAFGEVQGMNKKPAPDIIFKAMEALEASPDETVYIGDSEVDVLTAINAGLPFIGVSWGYRSRADLGSAGAALIADTQSALFALIECDRGDGPSDPTVKSQV